MAKSLTYKNYRLETKDKVPDGYVGMTDVLSLPRFKMSKEQQNEIRKSTYKFAYNYCKEKQITDLRMFWNCNSDLMLEDMNHFCKLGTIGKLAPLIEMFVDKRPSKSSDNKIQHVSFGLKEKYIRDFVASNCEVVPIKKVLGKPKTYDGIRYEFSQIALYDEENNIKNRIRIRKTPVLARFKQWCKINSITITQGLTMAMERIIDDFPTEGLPSLKDFENGETIKREFYDVSEPKYVSIRIHQNVYAVAKTIMENYNSDLENISKAKLSFSTYVTKALDKFNGEMPLKYSNPKLNNELLKEKEREKIRKKMMKGDE